MDDLFDNNPIVFSFLSLVAVVYAGVWIYAVCDSQSNHLHNRTFWMLVTIFIPLGPLFYLYSMKSRVHAPAEGPKQPIFPSPAPRMARLPRKKLVGPSYLDIPCGECGVINRFDCLYDGQQFCPKCMTLLQLPMSAA